MGTLTPLNVPLHASAPTHRPGHLPRYEILFDDGDVQLDTPQWDIFPEDQFEELQLGGTYVPFAEDFALPVSLAARDRAASRLSRGLFCAASGDASASGARTGPLGSAHLLGATEFLMETVWGRFDPVEAFDGLLHDLAVFYNVDKGPERLMRGIEAVKCGAELRGRLEAREAEAGEIERAEAQERFEAAVDAAKTGAEMEAAGERLEASLERIKDRARGVPAAVAERLANPSPEEKRFSDDLEILFGQGAPSRSFRLSEDVFPGRRAHFHLASHGRTVNQGLSMEFLGRGKIGGGDVAE
jgi:hypothetical protein